MIYIAADAKSQNVKSWIKSYLDERNHKFQDLGAENSEDARDITELIPLVAENSVQSDAEAIVVCGNGIGVTIGMNRYKGIRAGLAVTPEFAEWAKVYDNCNVLCLAAWSVPNKRELDLLLNAWFGATFDPIPRRTARLKKMDQLGF